MTEVTKEDREAAFNIHDYVHVEPLEEFELAFARHREASTEALQTEVAALRAENARLRASIDSLTSWLLHRFGPNTPEGLEAQTARAALENREASTEALRAVLRRIESAEYINSLQGTANFERLQQIARAALENRDDHG